MPQDTPEVKFQIGHVLFIDIVSYSKLLINEQSEQIQKLREIVRETEQFRLAEAEGKLLRLPTGDGGALVFRNHPEAPLLCAVELSKALKDHPELRVRMGIHSGPVNEVADLNEQANMAGAGINIAQRVMDFGDAGHILLSKRVADDLAPYPKWNRHLHDLGECEVKHGDALRLVNFFTEQVGNPDPPRKCQVAKQVPAPKLISRFRNQPAFSRALWAVAALLILGIVIGGLLLRRQLRPGAESTSVSPGPTTNAKSIAVLPFENLSHDPDNAFFADGIQEEILTRLSKIADLKVISRTSTQRYKSRPDNLVEIAKQLGVAHILEGSVQKAADQVRVNVQLINAKNDSHLWADKFDRKLTDIFAVETEIASKIADTLQAKLAGGERNAIAVRPTGNSEAHQLYLRGRFYWNKWLGPDFGKSREYYQQAIEVDPTYALAYAGLADFYGFSFANGLLPPEEKWAKLEEENAKKALELDPTLGEAYNPLAAAKLYYYRDWPAAEADFRRGLELSPNFAEMHHHYALCLILFGRDQEAFAEMERALELDPLSARCGCSLGWLYFFTRQYDAAINQYRKTLELDPNYPILHEWLGYAYEKKQMQKEAIEQWSKGLSLIGAGEDASLLEGTYAASGFDAALHALGQKRLERCKQKTANGEYVPAQAYLEAYMRLGDKEQAFVWLAKAFEERNRIAFQIRINPLYDSLRSDPRFEKLSERVLQPEMK